MNYISSLLSSPLEIAELQRMDPSTTGKKKKGAADKKGELVKRSTESWESVLRYLVTPAESVSQKTVSNLTRELFQHVGFSEFFIFFNII